MSTENKVGLYIHVPFCAKKCPYCDFYSVSFGKKIARLYTDAVIRNIKSDRGSAEIDTIYFGGVPLFCQSNIFPIF